MHGVKEEDGLPIILRMKALRGAVNERLRSLTGTISQLPESDYSRAELMGLVRQIQAEISTLD